MKLECSEFDPLTRPKYTIAGCPGCANCKIITDGAIICSVGCGVLEVTLPVMEADNFTCKDFSYTDIKFDFGCIACEHYDDKTNKCKKGHEIRDLYVRLF